LIKKQSKKKVEEENDISSKFKKTKKPTVPSGFFENFYEYVQTEIDSDNAFSDLKIVKRKQPGLPENFTKNFEADLIKKIAPKSSNSGRIIRLVFLSAAASIAAVLAILFYVNQHEQASEISKTEVGTTQDDEVIDSYIAYLDEDEMIDYIVENNITIGDAESDDIYDYVESDIEDIYLDL